MQFPNRTSLALGLLLALGATDADAWGRKKETPPVAPVAPAPVVAPTPPPPPPPPQQLIYSGDPAVAPQVAQTDLLQTAPADVQAVARWVSSSRDNRGAPFLMVDKPTAQAYVFNGDGQLVAVAPVLMGMGKGDHMIYRYPTRTGSIVVAGGGKLNRDVPKGTEQAILRQAGLK